MFDVRITRITAALVGVVLLALAGCSREAGPMPEQQPQDPGPGALAVKLDALSADECFRSPAAVPPPNCEKYVTQVASIPGTVRGFADAGGAALTEAANDLAAGVAAYRSNGCAQGGGQECAGALTEIATALEAVRTQVSALPDVATPPS